MSHGKVSLHRRNNQLTGQAADEAINALQVHPTPIETPPQIFYALSRRKRRVEILAKRRAAKKETA